MTTFTVPHHPFQARLDLGTLALNQMAEQSPDTILLTSPIGLPFQIAIAPADWDSRISVATLTTIAIAAELGPFLDIASTLDTMIARLRLQPGELPDGIEARARLILGKMIDHLRPETIKVANGTLDELTRILQDFSTLAHCRIDAWSRTGEEDSFISLYSYNNKIQAVVEHILRWFDPVGSKPNLEDHWVDHRESLPLPPFHPQAVTAHERLAIAERLRQFLITNAAPLGWNDGALKDALAAIDLA